MGIKACLDCGKTCVMNPQPMPRPVLKGSLGQGIKNLWSGVWKGLKYSEGV